MALKTKGGHTPKAGPKKKTAKDEAEAIRLAIEENTVRRVRVTRRAGRVREYRYKEPGRNGQQRREFDAVQRELALAYQLRTPKGLSDRAQWMELRLPHWQAWDWWHLFDTDKDMWPFIIEIAEEEYGA